MLAQEKTKDLTAFPAVIENPNALGRVLLVCEHASPVIPAAWGNLGLSDTARLSHVAWDIGALDLARGLAARLDACLVHAPISRLVYDLNRAPDQSGAMPAMSEIHPIPGNAAISPQERALRTKQIYHPFHDALHDTLTRRIALGQRPVMVTIHSFTPVYFGVPRAVEFGVIHDQDPQLAKAILAHAPAGLVARMNDPYSATDGVTHTLRLHATPYGLPNAMLEIRNDLIDSSAKAQTMAERLAPAIDHAVASLEQGGD